MPRDLLARLGDIYKNCEEDGKIPVSESSIPKRPFGLGGRRRGELSLLETIYVNLHGELPSGGLRLKER
jgi:hypothetical protein